MPVTNTLKLVITQFFFFLAMKDMSRCLLSMCTVLQCHLLWEQQCGYDSRAHPYTVTLVVEVEQERVNDAARVGQGTDLVVAPLFLCCLSLSPLSLSVSPAYALSLSHCGFSQP